MPSVEEIKNYQERLDIHRRNLALYLKQQAQLGSAYSPPAIINGIHEERHNIRQIKSMLTSWGVAFDHSIDDDPSVDEKLAAETVNNHPLLVRAQFLDFITEQSNAQQLQENADALVELVSTFKSGSFYSKQLSKLISRPAYGFAIPYDTRTKAYKRFIEEKGERQHQELQRDRLYCEQLKNARDQVHFLLRELINLQG
jgi:hypothetical protein